MLDNSVLKTVKRKGRTKEDKFINEVINDLWICLVSREVSILGRKEVLTGKAKFGILGDGKEVPQVAMAKFFKKGDFRSGYYRDQTFMFALGLCTVEEYFAQLYADPERDPFSSGRQMNAHFATAFIDSNDNFIDFTEHYNVTSDISSTGGQMARALGIAFASKKFREEKGLKNLDTLSRNGNEVSFCTIGDASTSEGVFWESMNAAAVMQVPLAVSVWDDGYGISVPIELQTTKGSISRALEGFLENEYGKGIMIYKVNGWDYVDVCETYERAIEKARKTHQPCLIHVKELTQQLGHSTSGSHERYKDKERLQWERDMDCIEKMIEWMIESGVATDEQIQKLRAEARVFVKDSKNRAWKSFNTRNAELRPHLLAAAKSAAQELGDENISKLVNSVSNAQHIAFHEISQYARRVMLYAQARDFSSKGKVQELINDTEELAEDWYHTHLYSESEKNALRVPYVAPVYSDDPRKMNGYELLNVFFDQKLQEIPEFFAFGEDVGMIGAVNQGFAGLQMKYGTERVFDTGIREWTIVGQAIGMAMRGLRPLAEIQYLDYLAYAFSPLTDDLATLRYRSAGLQCAPVIIRTRGHRLEGIWHAGSPLGMMINAMHGMYICVPRNMVQAAGMYNTLLQSNDPAIVVECLNGYRLKEDIPENVGQYTTPLGQIDVLTEGADITLVTYGSCVRIAQKGIALIAHTGITVELIDVQTLVPFDLAEGIAQSLKKTSKIIFMDEDVPGGATAYMMQQVMDRDAGYHYLDAKPVTITATAHRTPFGSDGDYYSKPNAEDVAEAIMELYAV